MDRRVGRPLPRRRHERARQGRAGSVLSRAVAAFPNWTLEIEQTVDGGDRRVVVQRTASATFDGAPWQGIEPTGSKVTVRGIDVISLDQDGKVDHNTVYYDGMAFARQIGMLPRSGSTADRAVLATFNATTKAKTHLRNRRG